MGHLGIKQTDHMTPRTERAGLGFAPRGPRQLRHQMVRNQIAKLPQKRKLTGGLACVVFVYSCLTLWQGPNPQSILFYPSTTKLMGLL